MQLITAVHTWRYCVRIGLYFQVILVLRIYIILKVQYIKWDFEMPPVFQHCMMHTMWRVNSVDTYTF